MLISSIFHHLCFPFLSCWFGLAEEFHRAVKICTGAELSPHIVDTVFKIFDDDGDGQLSYKEFIAIMRDRLHRGFKVSFTTQKDF